MIRFMDNTHVDMHSDSSNKRYERMGVYMMSSEGVFVGENGARGIVVVGRVCSASCLLVWRRRRFCIAWGCDLRVKALS